MNGITPYNLPVNSQNSAVNSPDKIQKISQSIISNADDINKKINEHESRCKKCELELSKINEELKSRNLPQIEVSKNVLGWYNPIGKEAQKSIIKNCTKGKKDVAKVTNLLNNFFVTYNSTIQPERK